MEGLDLGYNNLEIYQLAKKLIKIVYKLTDKFPKQERYNLTDQSKRSVVSICLNIVEGNSRHFRKEQAKYADNALASLLELTACFEIAIDLGYVSKEDLGDFYAIVKELYFKLIGYRKSKFK